MPYLERMARHLRLQELLVAIEGLALQRLLLVGRDEEVRARIDEVRRLVDPAEWDTFGQGTDVPELDVVTGYSAWAETYDRPGNPVVAAEQAAVWPLLEESPPGRALDAACGTGRHSRRLADLGHQVVGVDLTPAMMERARAAVPEARFLRGDLSRLPLEAGSVDLAVLALALDHAPDVSGPIGELARVVRPGGRVLISDVHPVLSALGAAAFFRAADGSTAFVGNHRHLHGEYLDALSQAGLEIRRCLEPRFTESEAASIAPLGTRFVPDAVMTAYVGLPLVLVWDLVRP